MTPCLANFDMTYHLSGMFQTELQRDTQFNIAPRHHVWLMIAPADASISASCYIFLVLGGTAQKPYGCTMNMTFSCLPSHIEIYACMAAQIVQLTSYPEWMAACGC